MRKLVLTLVLALLPVFTFAQHAFDKFDGQADVTSVIVNKKMFDMLGKMKVESTDEKAEQFTEMVSKINDLKLFTTTNTKVTAEMKTSAKAYIKSAGLEELLQVNSKGRIVTIHVKSGAKDSQIKELLVFGEGSGKDNQTVLLLLTGDFDIEEISSMMDQAMQKGNKKDIEVRVNDAKNVVVYPNPVAGTFYIDSEKAAEIKMYDSNGKLVKSEKYNVSGVSVSDLSKGTYVVEITTEDKKQVQRIIVK